MIDPMRPARIAGGLLLAAYPFAVRAGISTFGARAVGWVVLVAAVALVAFVLVGTLFASEYVVPRIRFG